MKCNICNCDTKLLFKSLVLNKYQADYFKCPNCDFIQIEKPHWINEAYSNAITSLDVGLVSRNLAYSSMIEEIIRNNFNYNGKFLDYAGGYGLFVRLMRDKGFDFYREDKYCKNIFAENFDIEDLSEKKKFEIVTAFEVFEHLENPIGELKDILNYSDAVIFSTELQPDQKIKNVEDWWYFTPETGQHISFYSKKTLKYIADKFNLFFYSKGDLHILSKCEFKKNPLIRNQADKNENKIEMKSLIQFDFEFAKNIIKEKIAIKREFNNIIEDESLGNSEKKQELLNILSLIRAKLETIETELDSTKTELDLTKAELNLTKAELNLTKTELNSTKTELLSIYSSYTWIIISILQKVLIPEGSWRRKTAIILGQFTIKYLLISLNFLRKIRGIFFLCKNYLIKFKPRKKRKINSDSKKIVYIGHSYHNKTKSTDFLIEYLKQFFEVEEILDESWLGKTFPDLSFIDESYLGVIFFQLLPSKDIIRNIKNDNIIYFPMCDQSGRLDFGYWNNYRDLKIINFSKTLHSKLAKWGFESMFVQYFPKPGEFISGSKSEVFFWQRLTKVNINIVTKIFGKNDVKIHIHKAIDPGQEFIQPNQDVEKKFQITYSEWFDTKEEMWDVIKQKGIYVAPREYEGIGMSFLEAMAMGKAVIAADNPTMNEYIENGKNGYLFDLKNPKELDLSDIKHVQKTTYEYIQKGYEKWKKERHGIIDFIKKC